MVRNRSSASGKQQPYSTCPDERALWGKLLWKLQVVLAVVYGVNLGVNSTRARLAVMWMGATPHLNPVLLNPPVYMLFF